MPKKTHINFIIKILLKRSYLIILTTFIFASCGYLYSTIAPKIYETKISLYKSPYHANSAFREYQENSVFRDTMTKHTNLSNIFFERILSEDIFNTFLEKEGFKDYYLSIYQKKWDSELNLKEIDIYYLKYNKDEVNGPELLNKYIDYLLDVSKKIYTVRIIDILEAEANKLRQELRIAKALDIKEPISNTTFVINNSQDVTNFDGIVSGYIILGEKVASIDKLIDLVKKQEHELDLIFDKSSSPNNISFDNILIFFISMVGFFLSVFVVFLLEFFKKKKLFNI